MKIINHFHSLQNNSLVYRVNVIVRQQNAKFQSVKNGRFWNKIKDHQIILVTP